MQAEAPQLLSDHAATSTRTFECKCTIGQDAPQSAVYKEQPKNLLGFTGKEDWNMPFYKLVSAHWT